MKELVEMGFTDVSLLMKPGVYVLCYKGEVNYVGCSTRPLARIGQHDKRVLFDSVYFIPCPNEDVIYQVERELQMVLKPRMGMTKQLKIPEKDWSWRSESPAYAALRAKRTSLTRWKRK